MARYDIAEGEFEVDGARVAIVAARFNSEVVDALLRAAIETLRSHGVAESDITVVRVPGAFELPLLARRLASRGGFEAIIALGAVVRGDTPHFDYVAGECARGIARVGLDFDLPVVFGVLTTDDMTQARARAGAADGNKGRESALAALEMVSVLRRFPP